MRKSLFILLGLVTIAGLFMFGQGLAQEPNNSLQANHSLSNIPIQTTVTGTPPTATNTSTATPTPPTPTATRTPTITWTPGTATPTSEQPAGPSDVRIIDIRYYPPGDDADLEYVALQNRGRGYQNLAGWRLQDKDGNSYQFPDIYIGTDRDIRLWTGQGINQHDVFWGLRESIWDNNTDCAYLINEMGVTVDEYCYQSQPCCCTYVPNILK